MGCQQSIKTFFYHDLSKKIITKVSSSSFHPNVFRLLTPFGREESVTIFSTIIFDEAYFTGALWSQVVININYGKIVWPQHPTDNVQQNHRVHASRNRH